VAHSLRKGTLRGLHWQDPPHPQAKLVRCTRGAIYDVIVDLRRESPTYCRWTSVELHGDRAVALYVPVGFAHGYQTLTDLADVSYQMGDVWAPHTERGIRWNDPLFAISWPVGDPILSARDRAYPDFVP
jgi:dTDP-4-dehydrorhamnose 3,5-epimerase